MSQKRKPSPPPPTAAPRKKPTRNPPPAEKERASVNELKKRIRNATRLLARDDLPADARIVQERALAGFEEEMRAEVRRRERSEMISRYHFVRFLGEFSFSCLFFGGGVWLTGAFGVDRKSATKDLNRLLREENNLLRADGARQGPGWEALGRRIHAARVSLNYTIYYPLTEKYVSLYADQQQRKKQKVRPVEGDEAISGNDDGSARLEAGTEAQRPEMWFVIERVMGEDGAEGKLEDLREGRSSPSGAGRDGGAEEKVDRSAATKAKSKRKDEAGKAGKGRKETGKENIDMRDADGPDAKASEDDASDGGFFE